MDRSNSSNYAAKFFSYLLIFQLIFPPAFIGQVHAALVTDPNANVAFQPQINSQTGVPVVNVVAPNNSGLSHNKYKSFDVGEEGLVFNNSLVAGDSKLAGRIVGNPLFGGRTASIILNEVTGVTDSELRGLMEVFGDKANVILANPNGITCNGCGFINTGRATLTTGAPDFSNGKLRFDIDDGLIRFEGEGHSYRSFIDEMDVLARFIDINGDISTKERLSLAAGRFIFDYSQSLAGGSLTDWVEKKQDQKAADRALAIDGTIFGAMQSGQIDVMGTENGLGVKTDGYLFAQADDLFIQSAGGVSLNNADAVREINVEASGNVEVGADLIANQKIELIGQKITTSHETNIITNELVINASGTTEIHGELKALKIDIQAAETNNTADILAVNNLNVNVSGRNQHKNARIASDVGIINANENKFEDITLSFGSLNLTSLITDFKRVNAQLESSELDVGSFNSTDFMLNADVVNLAFAQWQDTSSTFNINEYRATGQSAIVNASDWTFLDGVFTSDSLEVNNGSRLYALTSTINADNLTLTDSGILSNELLVNTSRLALTSSALQAQDATLNADKVTLEETSLAANNLTIQAEESLDLDAGSVAIVTEQATIDTDVLSLNGGIKSSNLNITAEQARLAGVWQVSEITDVNIAERADIDTLDVGATTFNFDAESGVWNGLLLKASHADINLGLDLDLVDTTIEADTSNISARALNANENTWLGANAHNFTVTDFNNNGTILSAEQLTVDAEGTIDNAGNLASFSKANLSASDLNNAGVVTGSDLFFQAENITNNGKVSADNLDVQYENFHNENNAKLLTGQASFTATSNTALFANYGEQVAVDAIQWLQASTVVNSGRYVNAGTLQGNALNFSGLQTVENSATGVMLSNGAISIGNEAFEQQGRIDTAALNIIRDEMGAEGAFNNEGEIYADNLNVNTKADFINSKKILAGTATVNVKKVESAQNYNVFSNTEGALFNARELTVEGGHVENAGQLVSTEFDITGIRGGAGLDGSSFTNTETGVIVQRQAVNDDNEVTAYGLAAFSAFNTFTNSGAIEVDELLTISDIGRFSNEEDSLEDHQANNTLNSAAKITSAGGLVITDADSFSNTGLLISSALHIESKDISNAGIIGAGEAILSSSENDLHNNGKIYQSNLELSESQRVRLAARPDSVLSSSKNNSFDILATNLINSGTGSIEIKKGNINLSRGNIDNQGLIRELNDGDDTSKLNLIGLSSLENRGDLSITSALVIKDGGLLKNLGTDSYLQAASLSGESDAAVLSNIHNQGAVLVRDDISLHAQNFSNESDAQIFANNTDLTSDNQLLNSGLIQSEERLTLATQTLQNNGELIGKGTTSLNVDKLANNHLIYGNTLNVGSSSNRIIETTSTLPVRAQALAVNEPTGLVAGETLNLYVDGVMRDVYQATNILIDGQSLSIEGTVIGDNKVDINANDLTINSGGEVNIGNGVDASEWRITNAFVNKGDVDFESDLAVYSDSLINHRNIRGDASLDLNTGLFNNKAGAVVSIKDSITGAGERNALSISGGQTGFSNGDKSWSFANYGTLHSDGALNVAARTITVNGNIQANDNSEWHFDSFTNNDRITVGGIWSLGQSEERSGNVTNFGKLYAENISAHLQKSLVNNAEGQIVAYSGNVEIDTANSIYAKTGSSIFAKEEFHLKAVGGINNNGIIESLLEGGNSTISATEFNNGYVDLGVDGTGIVNTKGSITFLNGDVNNNGYRKSASTTTHEEVVGYNFSHWTKKECTKKVAGNCVSKATRYFYKHSVDYLTGDVANDYARSQIISGGELKLSNGNLVNSKADISAAGSISIKGGLSNESESVELTVRNVSWQHKNVDSEGHKRDYGEGLKSDFNSLDSDVKSQTQALIESKISESGNELYWDTMWRDDLLGDSEKGNIESNGVSSTKNPYSSGSIFSAGTITYDNNKKFLNTGFINVGGINARDREDITNGDSTETNSVNSNVDVKDSGGYEKGGFINSAGDGVVTITSKEPTPTVSLLSFIIPGLSFDALNAASVAGDKTAGELAAQAALQAQLATLDNDKDQNNKNLQSQTDSHGTQAPSLFDLDEDILARIIADTEYELSPEYIFDKVDPDKISDIEPKFFLDPYQEAQAITQAALQQTGTAFFSPDWDSSAQQRQSLYDNTLAYLNVQQGVTLGKALTRQQVSNLQQPMIWYVSMNIGGQEQLVPTVYLPEATLDQITTPSAGTIIADNMDIDVGNFTNTGDIKVANSARIQADIITNQKNVMRFGDDTNYTTIAGNGGNIDAGNLALISRSDINNNGGSLRSRGDLTMQAEGDINLNALQLDRRSQRGRNIDESTDFIVSEISAEGNASFRSGGDFNSQAAKADIGGNAIFDAENINLFGVTEREYEQRHKKKKGTFSSSKTTTQQETLTFVGSEFNVGGNMQMNAKNDITMVGTQLDIGGNAKLKAGNDVTLTAGINQDSYSKKKSGSGVATTSSQQKGHVKQTATGTSINAGKNLQIDSDGGDVTILASDLNANESIVLGDMNIKKDENGQPILDENGQFITVDGQSINNLTIGTVELKDESWNVKSSGLKGPLKDLAAGAAFALSASPLGQMAMAAGLDTEMEVGKTSETRVETTHHAASEVNAGKSLVVKTDGDFRLEGSQASAGEDALIETQNTVITGVENTTTTTESESTHTVGATQTTLKKDEITVAGATETKHTETTTTTETQIQKGGLSVGGSLSMNSIDSIEILGSDVNVEGDSQVKANAITVAGLKETTNTEHTEKTEVTTTSVGVKNAYVDTAYAAEAVTEAGAAVEAAQNALDDAKRRARDGSLSRDAVKDYEANLAAATAQLGQATIALAQSAATAAGTTGTGGFYASGSAEKTITEKTSTSTEERYIGSSFNVGGDATFDAAKSIDIIGSSMDIGGGLALNAEDINIRAGTEENTSSSSETTRTAGVTASYGSGGSDALSGGVNASGSNTDSESYSKTHINSTINAGSLTSTSDNLTLSGANVEIAGNIDIDTGNLTIESLQDEASSSSKTEGYNASMSMGADKNISPGSVGGNQNNSESNSQWVNNQTTLIGGTSGSGDVNISADKTNLTGAVVASATKNDDGTLTDNSIAGTGTLNLATDELNIKNIQDKDHSESDGINISTSGYSSTGTTTVGLTSNGHEREQTTLATLGGGNITKKDGSAHEESVTENINRDLNNSQEITKDQQTGGLDATVTVDHRLASESGRQSIAENFEDAENHFNDEILSGIKEGIETGSVTAAINAIDRKIDIRNGIAQIQEKEAENTDKINNAEGDAESKQAGAQRLSDVLTEAAGVDEQDILVYIDSNDQAEGFHANDQNLTAINAATTDITDGAEVAKVTVHETTHHTLNEQENGYSHDNKEKAATNDGEYAKELWKQQNNRHDRQTGGNQQEWLSNNANSQIVKNNNDKATTIPSNEREELLPQTVKDARAAVLAHQEKSQDASSDLKGDTAGTILTVAAIPGDVVVDAADAALTIIDKTTDLIGATGLLGEDLQSEAKGNISEDITAIENAYENKGKIVDAAKESLTAFGKDLSEGDPGAIRSLGTGLAEAAIPVGILAKAGKVDASDAPKADMGTVDSEMVGQDGPTYNAVVHDRSDSNPINDKMESAGDAPAWVPDEIVENKTLMPGTKLEMIVNDKQLDKIQKGEPWIGGWASQDKLPDTVQEARDLTAVKKEWKNDDEGSLHVIEFEIETPVAGNSGTANKMYDDMLDKELPGGVKQFEFEDKSIAFDSMKINSVKELKNNDK